MQGHRVESPPEVLLPGAMRDGITALGALEGDEVRNQLVDRGFRQIHVRVAQQRDQIVGVRSQPRILEIDDVELALVEHQVSAVVVAMTQHARLARQFLGQHAPFALECLPVRRRDGSAPVGFDIVFREELEFPQQLVDVKCDAIRRIRRRRQLGAPSLQGFDQAHRVAIEAAVFLRRGRAEVRLQRDVAEVLQQQDAKVAGAIEDRRDRQGHGRQQLRDPGKGLRVGVKWLDVQRQHPRRPGAPQHAEVSPVGGIAGERQHCGGLGAETAAFEIRGHTFWEHWSGHPEAILHAARAGGLNQAPSRRGQAGRRR